MTLTLAIEQLSLADRLLTPFQYGFMWQMMLLAALIGVSCALISCFLVLKGWSLMGDAISHAVFPGVVLAYIAGIPLGIGAFVAGLFCATATGWIKAHSRIKEDTVMGIVFTGLFALGLVMFTRVKSDVHLNHVLWGSLLGIETPELIEAIVCGGVALIVVALKRRDLLAYCFDPAHARAVGLHPRALHYLFLALVAAVIVASLQAVGIILTVAMLITPGCTARLLTDRFDRTLLIAAGTAAFSAFFGAYTSFFVDAPPGSFIVLLQAAVFTLALLFGPRHGLLAQRWARRAVAA